jgi:hypothetical protein
MSNHAFAENVVTADRSPLKIPSENAPASSESRLEEVVKEHVSLLLVDHGEHTVFTALDQAWLQHSVVNSLYCSLWTAV